MTTGYENDNVSYGVHGMQNAKKNPKNPYEFKAQPKSKFLFYIIDYALERRSRPSQIPIFSRKKCNFRQFWSFLIEDLAEKKT